VTALLYTTVWAALAAFGLGETMRRVAAPREVAARRAWWTHTAGLILMAIHIAIAMGVVHQWSHASAIEATARQTDDVYGLSFGGGVFINYVFVGVWAVDAWWWRARTPPRIDETSLRLLRVLYLVVLVNAAVIFASGWRQLAGAAFIGWLLWAWRGAPFRG